VCIMTGAALLVKGERGKKVIESKNGTNG
jgi:hypothetical protein